MPGRIDERKPLRCSFCNKTQDQVRKLIAGPNVYICDECVEVCSEIIEDEFKGDGEKKATLEQMLTSLETCFDAYDRLDYTLYRIGKDIKQVLK